MRIVEPLILESGGGTPTFVAPLYHSFVVKDGSSVER